MEFREGAFDFQTSQQNPYKNIVFDLDDTLYDHQLPFKRSVEKCFPTIDIQQIDNIYKRFRYWSDVAFPKYTKKLISIEQLRIFRCQKTMEEFGIDSISRTEALDFQADYEYELDQITMIPEIHQLLLALHKNRIPIGILTNGPVDLQSRNSKILVPINILKSKISSLVSPLTEELQKIAMKVM
ncbi:HAD hydrolase-like protein (plasmid) [Enterococcus faecium]